MKKIFILLSLLVSTINSHAYDSINQWMFFTGSYTYMNNKVEMGSKLGADAVNAVLEDNNGVIWFAVAGQGLKMFEGKKVTEAKAPKDSYVQKADVLSLACDSKNNIYIGTAEGLVKYDGTTWTNIDRDVIGMRCVTGIAITATDKVYISGMKVQDKTLRGAGVAFFNGENWTNYSTATGMPSDSVNAMVVDKNGHLWATFGQQDQGVAKFDGKNWKVIDADIPGDNVRALTLDKTGNAWIGTTKGVAMYDGTAFKTQLFSNGFSKKMLNYIAGSDGGLDLLSMAVESNGTIWLGTRDKGVLSYHDNGLKILDKDNAPLSGNSIGAIMIDKQNRKWLVSGTKDAGRWLMYSERGDKMSCNINYAGGIAVFKEHEKITDPKWTVYDNTNSDMNLGTSMGIIEGKQGEMWISNNVEGLIKLKDGMLTNYKHANPLQTAFTHVYEAPDGKIYLNTMASGVKLFENGQIADFAKWPNMGGVTGMVYDNSNTFWVSGTGGISKYTNNEWTTYDKKNGDLPTVIFYCIFKDSKGTLWAGSAKGLAKFDGTNWIFTTKKEVEFPSDDITAIAEDAKGRLWFGTKAGISILDGTTWTHVSKVESPKLNRFIVNDISIDKNGVAWIGSENYGLLKYDGTTWTQYGKETTGALYNKITAVKAAANGKIYVASEASQFNEFSVGLPSQSPEEKLKQEIEAKIKAADPKHILAILEM